jgi:mono/diheme cytochrome c family protein
MKRVILTVVITIVVTVVLPLIVLATGMVNMAATNDPGVIEKSLATFAVERSMAMRAPNQQNPFAGDSQAIATGLSHYAGMCVRCHGGPGVKPQEFAQGLNPPAPMLEHAAEEYSDGDLFWITKHGIRMTGMPAFGVTHTDDDIWKIVAFVNELPNLSAEQKAQLSEGHGQSHGHGHGGESHAKKSLAEKNSSSEQHKH